VNEGQRATISECRWVSLMLAARNPSNSQIDKSIYVGFSRGCASHNLIGDAVSIRLSEIAFVGHN
jgi:hypothetical protein